MKQKHLFLLLLFMLIGGVSSWAETTVIYERGTVGHEWTESNLSDFTANWADLALDDNYGACFTTSNNGSFNATKSLSIAEKSVVDVDAYVELFSNTSAGFSQCAYFRFGNIYIAENDQDKVSYYCLNGLTSSGSFNHGTYRNGSSPIYHIQIQVNSATNQLTKLYVASENDQSVWVNLTTPQTLTNCSVANIEFGFNKTTRTTNQKVVGLKSIKVSQTTQEIQTVNYTVKFEDTEGNQIKDDKEYTTGVVGEVYSALESDLATFYSNDASLKYVYKSGQNTSTEADADASKNVITLVFDKYEKYNYTVNAVNENKKVIKTVITGSAYSDESPTLGYSKYIENNGIWYETQSTYTVQVTSTEKEKTVTYSLANDVVAFTEIGTGNDANYSGGGYTVWNTKLVDYSASTKGSYKVGIYCVSNGSTGKNHRTEGIYIDGSEVASTDNHDGLLEYDVDLTPGNNLYVLGKGTNNYCDNIDYVVVKLVHAGPFTAGDDATRAIYNPTPETAKTAEGWTLEGNGNRPFVYGQLFENWNDNHVTATFDYYQTINNLPNGYYVVGADVYSDQGEINGAVGLYASSNGVEVHAPATRLATVETVATPVIKVVDGTLRIGVKNWATIAANWFYANNFTLTYVGAELSSCTRNSATGRYGTLCLPYDFDAVGAQLFTVTGIAEGVVGLTEVGIEGVAGQPYIFSTTADTQTFTQKSVTIAEPIADGYLVGTFEQAPVAAGNYVLQTQAGRQGFFKVSEETPITCGAFKCYLKGETVDNSRSAFFFDGDETAINALNALTNGKAEIYDLNGRKLNSMQKGINIVNGVKVLVK